MIDIVFHSNSDSDSEAEAEELYYFSSDLNEDEQDECTNNFLKWNKAAEKRKLEQFIMAIAAPHFGDECRVI